MPHSPAVCIGRKVETMTWRAPAQSTIEGTGLCQQGKVRSPTPPWLHVFLD